MQLKAVKAYTPASLKTYTLKEWRAEGEKRFGKRLRDWRFVCPVCGTIASGADFFDAGLDADRAADQIGYSCIGRFVDGTRDVFAERERADEPEGPCNYTTGGLLNVSPVRIIGEDENEYRRFAFAD